MGRAERDEDRRMRKFEDVYGCWQRGELSQDEAGELLGASGRQFRRYMDAYDEGGIEGLRDGRLGRPSGNATPAAVIEAILALYRRDYRGWNVKHFHEHLVRRHGYGLSYSLVKNRLQAADLVKAAPRKGGHRRKRERKPCVGMMLHQDGSREVWLAGQPAMDLIVTLDDATSEIYSAFLVDEEGTQSTFRALLEVFAEQGLPASLYTDRGSHYFTTPEAGGKVDKVQKTQVGRALDRLGVEHIPAYSPEARGRSERMFATLQDRLIKELALAGDQRGRGCELLDQGRLLGPAQPVVPSSGSCRRKRLRGDRTHATGRDIVHRGRAHGRSRQHRRVGRPTLANSGKSAAAALCRRPREGACLPGRHACAAARPARGCPLRGRSRRDASDCAGHEEARSGSIEDRSVLDRVKAWAGGGGACRPG